MTNLSRKEYQAQWYQKNKEHCKCKTYRWREAHPEYNKTFYLKNKEKYRQRYLDNKEAFLEARKKHHKFVKAYHPERLLYQAAKSRAKADGLPFNLELSDIVIPTHCPVFGTELKSAVGKKNDEHSPTLDRFNSGLGYTKGNVYVISWKANRLKSNASVEDLKKIVEWMEAIVAGS